MPVQIRGKQYFTVSERVTMIHTDFPNAIGIETEILSHDHSVDYNLLAERIEPRR